MDTDAVLACIDAYIDAATHYYDAKVYLEESSSDYEQQLTVLAEPLVPIARAVGRTDLLTDLTPALVGLGGYDWSKVRTAAQRLRTHIVERDALTAELGPSGPSLSAGRMHRRVWNAAASHWEDGDHAVAVREAARAVALFTRKRVGRSDSDGTELVGQSLSASEPKPGKPRLRLPVPTGVGDDTANSLQEGAAAFGRGCMMAIRNEQEALEMLAATISAASIHRALPATGTGQCPMGRVPAGPDPGPQHGSQDAGGRASPAPLPWLCALVVNGLRRP